MIEISVGEEILKVCPVFSLAAIECDIKNTQNDKDLWEEIELFSQNLRETVSMPDIKNRPNLAETRAVYKALGKEPNRYRPSGEALCRRIVKGVPLYKIDTAVDLINLLSMKYGYSIGGFDADTIDGSLRLGVGQSGEPFEAIGRGLLNIENMPVYRDAVGGIGTPSSDEERTKITSDTQRLLMIINGYSGENGLPEIVEDALNMIKKFLSAENIEIQIKSPPHA